MQQLLALATDRTLSSFGLVQFKLKNRLGLENAQK